MNEEKIMKELEKERKAWVAFREEAFLSHCQKATTFQEAWAELLEKGVDTFALQDSISNDFDTQYED